MHERIDEIRALLERADELGGGIESRALTTREGYTSWAPFYDEPGNEMIELEQPVVRAIIDTLPVSVALDAACGTGRHGVYLAELGHTVIGVDRSPEMLAVARAKLPDAELLEGDFCSLPLADDSVDLVVCALALAHVDELESAFRRARARAAPRRRPRRLRLARAVADDLDPDRACARRRNVRLHADTTACDERIPAGRAPTRSAGTALRGAPPYAPAAANVVWGVSPVAIVWHFQLEPSTPVPTR